MFHRPSKSATPGHLRGRRNSHPTPAPHPSTVNVGHPPLAGQSNRVGRPRLTCAIGLNEAGESITKVTPSRLTPQRVLRVWPLWASYSSV